MTRQSLAVPQAFRDALELHHQGRVDEAAKCYEAILKIDPKHFESLHFLGLARAAQGRLDESLALLRKALNQNPNSAAANLSLGDTLAALKRHDEAVARYRRALALTPGLAEAHNNLGTELEALGRSDEAIQHYRQAVAASPDFAEAWVNLGNAELAAGRADAATAHFEQALGLKPGMAQAHNNLGNALAALGRHDEAITRYEAAVALKPDYAGAHNNLGNVLLALNRPADAIVRFQTALACAPTYAEAHNNLGNAFLALNRVHEAIECYERAVAIKPDYVEAVWNDALARLTVGDFTEGWRRYESRWTHRKLGLSRRPEPPPAWLGEGELAGKTILLYAEQGLGDTIQFVRYAPLLAQRGAAVMIEAQQPLVRLLKGVAGVSKAIARDEAPPPCDFQCSLMSLPLALATTVETIPRAVPYLTPPPDGIEKWRSFLGEQRTPLIGLTWSGSATHRNDHNRSLPLAGLRPILDMSGARFVALQKEVRESDAALLRSLDGVLAPGESLVDFADTAALISLLDLVIAVDTAVAHLAGAMGKPVWLLLPFAADWRWMLAREDSPWYPTARLFRQQAIGDWDGVIARVAEALRDRFAGATRPS